LARVYQELAISEEAHAQFWEDKLRAAGERVPPQRPSWRSRALSWLGRRFGPQAVLPALAGAAGGDTEKYSNQAEARGTSLPGEEPSHARLLDRISRTLGAGIQGSTLGQLEG